MDKSDKNPKKEMTLCEACIAILEDSRDILFDFISSIGEKSKSK